MAEARKRRRNGRRGRNGSQNNARAQATSAEGQEQAMSQARARAQQMMREQTDRAGEATAVWGDLNQRVMQDFADLWLRGARESTRALSRIQEANLEAWREAQGAAFRWLRRGVGGTVDTRGTGTSRAA